MIILPIIYSIRNEVMSWREMELVHLIGTIRPPQEKDGKHCCTLQLSVSFRFLAKNAYNRSWIKIITFRTFLMNANKKSRADYSTWKHSQMDSQIKSDTSRAFLLKLYLFTVILILVANISRLSFFDLPAAKALLESNEMLWEKVFLAPPTILVHQFDMVARLSAYTMGSPLFSFFRVLLYLVIAFCIWQHLESKPVRLSLRSLLLIDLGTVVASIIWLNTEREAGLPLPYDEWYCLIAGLYLSFIEGRALYILTPRKHKCSDHSKKKLEEKAKSLAQKGLR